MEDADVHSEAASVVYDSIYACSDRAARRSYAITLIVNGQPCEGLMATGATRTILTNDVVQPSRPSNRILKAYNGGEMNTLGMADVNTAVGDQTMQCSCRVLFPAARGKCCLARTLFHNFNS